MKKSRVFVLLLGLGIFVSGCTNGKEETSPEKEAAITQAEEVLAEKPVIYASGTFMGLMDSEGAILMDGENERITQITALSNSTLLEYTTTTHDVFYFNIDGYQVFTENPEFRIHSKTFRKSDYGSYEDSELDKFGLLLSDGTIVKEAQEMPEGISEVVFRNSSFAYVYFRDGSYGLMNNEGTMLLEDIEDLTYLEEEGEDNPVAVLRIDGSYGVVHKKKGLLLSPEEVKQLQIKNVFPYAQRAAAIYETEEGKYGLINQEGEVIYQEDEPLLFKTISPFSEKGLALAESYGDDLIIDETGETVLEITDEQEEELSVINGFLDDDTILVAMGNFRDGNYALANEKLEVVERISGSYENIPFSLGKGLFSVKKDSGDTFPTIIDSSGKEILSKKESQEKGIYKLNKFKDSGLAVFYTEEQEAGLLNQKGEILIDAKNDSEIDIEQIQNIYEVTESASGEKNKKHYYDKDGQLFYQPKEEEQLFFSKGLIMVVKPDGETDVYDGNGYLIKTVKVKADE